MTQSGATPLLSMLPAMMVFFRRTVPEPNFAPPPAPSAPSSTLEMLLVIVTLFICRVASECCTMPPAFVSVAFPLIVLFVIVKRAAGPEFRMPPPSVNAVFPLIVLPTMLITPPSLSTPPALPELAFPATALLVNASVPSFLTPLLEPLVIVVAVISTLAPDRIWNTVSRAPPSTMVSAAPAPVRVTSSVMSRSPVAAASSRIPAMVSVYVPAGRVIASAPARALASWMAARSVQKPEAAAQMPSPGETSTASAVLSTMKVLAFTGAGNGPAGSKTSNPAASSSAPSLPALCSTVFPNRRLRFTP